MNSIGAFISGCAGLTLNPEERGFFCDIRPWGLILFKRNCETPDQLKSLTAEFRQTVGRKNAPVFIDQEGGRVDRLGAVRGPRPPRPPSAIRPQRRPPASPTAAISPASAFN
jgi:beta-N-acetylhexosaminidase